MKVTRQSGSSGRTPMGGLRSRPDATVAVADLREHGAAGLVPALAEADFERLARDVAERGVVDPLAVTAAGVVLDGRHRLRAALRAGLGRVPVRVLPDGVDEVEFIVRAAVLRRQLNESQRAAIAVDCIAYEAARDDGFRRQRSNLRHQGVEVVDLPARGRTRDRFAALVGVSGRLIQYAYQLKIHAPDLFHAVKNGETRITNAIAELKRRQTYATIGATPPLPAGLFDLIYADPPWQMGNPSGPWSPEQHYPTQPLDDIKALPIPAADNAVLLLWVPASLLPHGLEVIHAWGFTYRTELCWDKGSIGPGQWLRMQHEPLLLATRGTVSPPPPTRRCPSVIQAQRRGHSTKPDQAYDLIERMYPRTRKLELYARTTRPGWTSWGNQIPTKQAA